LHKTQQCGTFIAMGYFTEDQIKAKLNTYSDMLDAIAAGQSYSFNDGHGTMFVSRASLPSIEKSIQLWERRLADLSGEGSIVSWRATRR
jgi:hypothetical protein